MPYNKLLTSSSRTGEHWTGSNYWSWVVGRGYQVVGRGSWVSIITTSIKTHALIALNLRISVPFTLTMAPLIGQYLKYSLEKAPLPHPIIRQQRLYSFRHEVLDLYNVSVGVQLELALQHCHRLSFTPSVELSFSLKSSTA